MQRVLQSGWQGYAKPMVADYVDKLAAEIGSPPDAARAQALVARLPISVRIDGPQVRYDSHPEVARAPALGQRRRRARLRRRGLGPGAPAPPTATASPSAWPGRCRATGRASSAGSRWARCCCSPCWPTPPCAGCCDRSTTSAPAWRVSVRATSASRSAVVRRDELGELAERINPMAHSLHGMLDAKRALLLAISHELRSPLTRARVNAELVGEGEHRDALLRDLGEMRDLITDLLESERLASGHAALQTEAVDLAALVRELLATQFARHAVTLRRRRLARPAWRSTRCACACCCATWSTTRCATAPAQRRRRWWCWRATATASCAERARLRPRCQRRTARAPGRAVLPRRQRAPAQPPAAWAWACTCAVWWRRRMVARWCSATPQPGLEVTRALADGGGRGPLIGRAAGARRARQCADG